jgi:Chitobiase/beta-hexosaminidase C-terminal domain
MRVSALAGLVLAATAASAFAFWAATSAAGSTGMAAAATVNQGATPSAYMSAVGREVSVTWGASTLSNGAAVSGYLVKRYPDGGGVGVISPIGSCTGTVAGITCVEDDTPAGTWRYTITPVIGTWHGAESAVSGVVTVSAAGLTVSGSPFANSSFTPAIATTTGSVSGFSGSGSGGHGEGLSYRLDSATALSGSPAYVGTNGNAAITSLGIPKSAGDGSHTVYALGDAAYLPSQASAGIVIDTTAPTVTAQLSPTPGAGGWNNTSPVSVALSADDGTGSGVEQIKYTVDGSDPTTSGTAQVYSGSPFSIAAEGTTTVRYLARDVAGNASAVQTQLVKIDTAPPTNSVSLIGVTSDVYPTAGPLADGATIYYRGAAAGTFSIQNAVADALSGPASSATSSFAGASAGWSHVPSLVATPSGGPYDSNGFSWSAGTTSSPGETITGRDVAGNFASTTLSFVNDSSGPSGGSVDATGLGGSGGRYSTSTTLSISFAKGSDSGSGLAATGAELMRASATLSSSDGLSAGSCGTYGSYAQVGANDPASPYTDNAAGGVASGHCYRYEYVATDNVGNTTTYVSPDVEVDASGPSAPSVSLSSASGNTYLSGTTAYINAQAGKSGSFQAAATTTDNDSGILKVNFPSPNGFSSGGGDVNSSPFQTTYNWSGAVAASGTQTITASNNATLTNTATFTITPDTTNPTGGALTVNGTAASGAGSNSYDSSGNFTISAISDYTDSGSGLASSLLTRQSATLSSSNGIATGTCGSFGSATTIASRAAPIAQTLTGPNCYLYTLTGTDNVGNTVSITTTVKVDASGPSAPSVSLSSASGNTYLSGTTAYINAQAGKSGSFQAAATTTDNDSGILKVNFPSPNGFSSGGGDVNSSPFQTTYNWSGAVAASGTQTITASNNATLTNTATFTITPDTTNPTGGALTVNGTAASGAGSNSSTTNPNFLIGSRTDYSEATGAQSGLASSTLTIQSETLTNNSTCGAAGSGGPYTTPTTISGTTNPAVTVGYCYLYTLTGTDNVGNTVNITTTVKVPFAGIDWTGITTAPTNKAPTCTYTTITAVTCTVSGIGSGGTFTAKVTLIDANHASVSNTTGSAITVSQVTTGQGTGAPASVTINQNASASSTAFTVTLNNGSNKTATITATIVVNGVTYTVNCQVSS